MHNEDQREIALTEIDSEELALAFERDARRYDKAYTEEQEVRLR